MNSSLASNVVAAPGASSGSVGDRIAARLIQTGKNAQQQPLKNRAAISTLRHWNPEFEYLFFDDAQVLAFIDQRFPQYRRVFDSFPFRIQRYDFFRYLAVYWYGGFYFDLDVFLASSLSPLLECGCVFPFEGLTFSRFLRRSHHTDWQIGNYAFGAAAGHPFMKAVIENCVKAQTDVSWVEPMMAGMPRLSRTEFFIMNTTGPGLLTRTLVENPALASTVTVLFPDANVCDSASWNRFGDIGIHLMDGSWRLSGGFVSRRAAQLWEIWTLRKLLAESRRMGPTRRPESARLFAPPVTAAEQSGRQG